MVDGGWWPTFWFFKSLDNNMVYSYDIDVYVYKRNRCRTKVLWFLKFFEVGGPAEGNPKPSCDRRFSDFCARLSRFPQI